MVFSRVLTSDRSDRDRPNPASVSGPSTWSPSELVGPVSSPEDRRGGRGRAFRSDPEVMCLPL